MRIWSLHPEYLDTRGLLALWRETLLARKVLENKTKGYNNHPQLARFRKSEFPIDAINFYLAIVYEEAVKRNYHFDSGKPGRIGKKVIIPVTVGQILYERNHLLSKLKLRDPEKFIVLQKIKYPEPHPLFIITGGDAEVWEKIKVESLKVF